MITFVFKFNKLTLERAAELLRVKLGNDPKGNWQHPTDVFFRTWHPAGEARKVIGM